jgi:alpha-D-xyloside xylohydrolase
VSSEKDVSTEAFSHAAYRVIGELKLVETTRNSSKFVDGANTPIEVSAHLPGIFRVRIGKTRRPDYGLLATPDPQTTMAVEETGEGWHHVHDGMTLAVTRSKLRLAFSTSDKLIARSITDQHFRGRTRVPAFGHDATNGKWCVALELKSDTAVYGFGEKFGPLNKRGQLIRGRIEDALGVNTELSYKSIPFFWTSDGWGMLVHTTGVVRHGVGYPQWSHRSYIAEIDDDAIDLFLFAGDGEEILQQYVALTGRPAQPPLWSYGMWLSRAYYKTPEEAIAVAEEVRRRGVPCDCITLDGRAAWDVRTRFAFEWDKSRFHDVRASLAALKALNLKVCAWEYPFVSIHNPLFKALEDKGWLLKNKDGKAYVFDWVKDPTDDPFGKVLTPLPPSGILDFTNPAAAQFWMDSHDKLFDDGVDVMKTDFGEQVEDDMMASNGDTGRHLHNVYPLLYNRAVFAATKRYNEAHGRGPAMVWGRDGFIGSQRYPMQWGGDPQTDWEAMAASIRAALGYGMSGVPYYSTDVGGFYGAEQPDAELFLRWTANGIFCSHFRYHGIGEREPWTYGDEAFAIAKKLLAFRYRMIPYIAGCAARAAETGMPMMRSMALAFPRDRLARSFELQYLFGDALLFAPIIAPGGETLVYLPAGENWIDLHSGETIVGGSVRQVTRALDDFALFGREGHVLCLGRAVQHTGEIDLDSPVEEAWLFGPPAHQPLVMNQAVQLIDGNKLKGIAANRCRSFGTAS